MATHRTAFAPPHSSWAVRCGSHAAGCWIVQRIADYRGRPLLEPTLAIQKPFQTREAARDAAERGLGVRVQED